ncbi:MAG: FoF1 ATP synthase subunit a [Bacillota bacterium]|nr:FoF1 ATP synthase subunit a [Bacillota bacterium]
MEKIKDALVIKKYTISWLGNFQISETVLVAWMVIGILLVAALVFRLLVFPRFKQKPKGLQNFIELIVEGAYNFAVNRVGKFGEGAGAYVLTIGAFLITAGLVEMLGFKPPMANIGFTGTLAIMSFILINYYGIKKKGLIGRIKSWGRPRAFIAPMRFIVEAVLPVSLACRLFGNVLGGLIVMDLIYAVMAYVAPAFLAIYFNLFHIMIQSYIFLNLTLTFAGEVME